MLDSFLWALRSLRKLYCKVAYLHVGVSIVYESVFKVGWRHFSFTLATQHFGVFLERCTMENSISSTCLPTLPLDFLVHNFLILCFLHRRRESNRNQSSVLSLTSLRAA